MKFKIYSLLIVLLCSLISYAQTGITGEIIDGDFNEPLPFTNIIVKETGDGATSDFDGNYRLELPEGVYTVVYSFVGYESKEITNIIVGGDQSTVVNLVLNSSAQGLGEVVISVDAKQNTESSVLEIQKRSVSLLDGISSQTFKKMGANNIANAIKSVPGVSVQGGKYIYVRGLGDRYSKSILNGVDIPGLDPDRNSIQMDLFPSNLISNVLVNKSARADLPADFTGGVINIITKDFPNQKEVSINVGVSYNPEMNFSDNYLSYQGGKTDFLGFDDGTRKNKIYNSILGNTFDPRLNSSINGLSVINKTATQFNEQMAPINDTSGINYNVGVSLGNQHTFENGNSLGYLGSLSYRRNQNLYQNSQDNVYNFNPNPEVFDFDENRIQKGTIGEESIIASGLFGITYKTNYSKFKLNALHIQNGESSSGRFRQLNRFSDFVDFNKYNLEYKERSITNGILTGIHNLPDDKLKVEWTLSGTLAKVHDKDIRNTTFQDEEGVFSFQENTEPKRIWRTLDEANFVSKIDITKRFSFLGQDAILKFGLFGSSKERSFSIDQFSVSTTYTSEADWSNYGGDPNRLFTLENLIAPNNLNGTYINSQTTIRQDANVFNSRQQNLASYLSTEFNIGSKLKSILGLRFENYKVYYTGENSQLGVTYANENIILKNNFFPSLNLIYKVNESQNLRLSYSLTTARPSFKEASIAEIYDPLSNLFFIGNIEVRPTYIDNFDLRFESFGEQSQLFAVSLFYKKLTDPIEIGFVAASTSNYKPLNLDNALVYGVELELRKKLLSWGVNTSSLGLNFNGSFILSEEQFSEDEYKLRTLGLRKGQNLGTTRQLQGQSPYLINSGIEYNNTETSLSGGLYFNVQGKTLEVVGDGFYPDVYTIPFNSLNFNLSKKMNGNTTLTFRLRNILNDSRESLFEGFGGASETFKFRNIGRTFSLSYSLNF
jgi:hypothetical protein